MYRSAVFLFCVLASQVAQIEGQEKIVGGSATTISQYPYQVAITSNGDHICGGAILNANHIITAAHCVNGASAASLKIRAGSTSRTTGGVVVGVASYKKHPSFNPSNLDYDMAIITLKSNLPIGANIKPVPIYTQKLYSGVNAVATGWGTLREGGNLSGTLQRVSLPVVPRTTCRSVFPRLSESMLCAGRMSGGVDTCQGDSGGPLVMNGYLIGVTSHGNGCGRVGYPGLYTKVPLNQNWIRANM